MEKIPEVHTEEPVADEEEAAWNWSSVPELSLQCFHHFDGCRRHSGIMDLAPAGEQSINSLGRIIGRKGYEGASVPRNIGSVKDRWSSECVVMTGIMSWKSYEHLFACGDSSTSSRMEGLRRLMCWGHV